MTTPHSLSTIGCLSVLALSLVGCATAEPRPESSLNLARAAITEAESSGGRQVAPVLLNQARDKVEAARQHIDQEEYPAARMLLEQATADARLAEARADTAKARQAVTELNETIEMLRQRLQEGQS